MTAKLQTYERNIDIADRVRRIRNARGIKPVEMARHLGITAKSYNKNENGEVNLTEEKLKRIAAGLGVTYDELVNGQSVVPTVVSCYE